MASYAGSPPCAGMRRVGQPTSFVSGSAYGRMIGKFDSPSRESRA